MSKSIKLTFKKGELNKELADFFKKNDWGKWIRRKWDRRAACSMIQPNKGVMQTLVTKNSNIETIDLIDPFAPVVPVNGAKIASSITAKPSNKKVAMVLRSCEIRGLVELVKLKQANLDNVLLIGIDCIGRYENLDF